jgi:hypothetical protein
MSTPARRCNAELPLALLQRRQGDCPTAPPRSSIAPKRSGVDGNSTELALDLALAG